MAKVVVDLPSEDREQLLQYLVLRANEFNYYLSADRDGDDLIRATRDAERAAHDWQLVQFGGPLSAAEVDRLRRALEGLPMCAWCDGLGKRQTEDGMAEVLAEVMPFLDRLKFKSRMARRLAREA